MDESQITFQTEWGDIQYWRNNGSIDALALGDEYYCDITMYTRNILRVYRLNMQFDETFGRAFERETLVGMYNVTAFVSAKDKQLVTPEELESVKQ